MLFYNGPLPLIDFYRRATILFTILSSALKKTGSLKRGPALDDVFFDHISATAGYRLNYLHLSPDDMMRLATSPFFAMSPAFSSPSTTSPFK